VRQVVEAGRVSSVAELQALHLEERGAEISAAPLYGDINALGFPPLTRPGIAEKPDLSTPYRATAPRKAPAKRTTSKPTPKPRIKPGAHPPADGSTRVSFDLPDEKYTAIKIQAFRERRTLKALLEEASDAYMKRAGSA